LPPAFGKRFQAVGSQSSRRRPATFLASSTWPGARVKAEHYEIGMVHISARIDLPLRHMQLQRGEVRTPHECPQIVDDHELAP
jgi:hypothetical protein